MPVQKVKRNNNVIQLCFYTGYGDKGKAIKLAILNAAKAAKLPVYRYILNKLGL